MKNLFAIILLFLANTISGIAQGISMIAIPWYFAQQGDMGRFGIIYLLTNIALLFWAPYSGILVDRYNRKHLFLGITLICGILVGTIAYSGWEQGGLSWFWVAIVFVVTFFNYNIHYPNLYAFVQEISEPRYYGKITSIIEVQGQLSNMLAGAGAALLLEGTSGKSWSIWGWQSPFVFQIDRWSIEEIFAVDAITYFIALIIIALISYQPMVQRQIETRNLRSQLVVGYRYLKEHPGIFLFGIASFSNFVATLLVNFFIGAVYVNNQLREGGDVYAISEIFYALGAVFAGVAIRRLFFRKTIPQSIILLTLVASGIFVVLTVNTQVWVFYAMLLLLGVANAGARILRMTYLFQKIPNQVFGRANGIFFLSNIGFRIFFLSIFSMYFFQQNNHIIYACAIISIFLLAAAAVMIRYVGSFD